MFEFADESQFVIDKREAEDDKKYPDENADGI
jgi:hypothetical protein